MKLFQVKETYGMKKIVSIILCVLLLASCAFTGSAAEEKTPVTRVGSKVPVVLVGGDGDRSLYTYVSCPSVTSTNDG